MLALLAAASIAVAAAGPAGVPPHPVDAPARNVPAPRPGEEPGPKPDPARDADQEIIQHLEELEKLELLEILELLDPGDGPPETGK